MSASMVALAVSAAATRRDSAIGGLVDIALLPWEARIGEEGLGCLGCGDSGPDSLSDDFRCLVQLATRRLCRSDDIRLPVTESLDQTDACPVVDSGSALGLTPLPKSVVPLELGGSVLWASLRSEVGITLRWWVWFAFASRADRRRVSTFAC